MVNSILQFLRQKHEGMWSRPSHVAALVAGDLAVIGAAVASAMRNGYLAPHKYLATNSDMWPHVLVIAAATLVALYSCDLYSHQIFGSWVQLANRILLALFLAILLALIATTEIGHIRPYIYLGSQAFSHMMRVTWLGVLLWRLAWMTLGPNAPNPSTTQRPKPA